MLWAGFFFFSSWARLQKGFTSALAQGSYFLVGAHQCLISSLFFNECMFFSHCTIRNVRKGLQGHQSRAPVFLGVRSQIFFFLLNKFMFCRHCTSYQSYQVSCNIFGGDLKKTKKKTILKYLIRVFVIYFKNNMELLAKGYINPTIISSYQIMHRIMHSCTVICISKLIVLSGQGTKTVSSSGRILVNPALGITLNKMSHFFANPSLFS